jgi:hypothetical protein
MIGGDCLLVVLTVRLSNSFVPLRVSFVALCGPYVIGNLDIPESNTAGALSCQWSY